MASYNKSKLRKVDEVGWGVEHLRTLNINPKHLALISKKQGFGEGKGKGN